MKKKTTLFFTAKPMRLKQILLLLFSFLQLAMISRSYAQDKKISGIVKDATGVILQGVTVTVKGLKTGGTASDANGRYIISVPNEKSVLEFSFVGFLSKEETVGNRTSIDVSLTAGVSSLDEVVVIGYGGTQKKRDVTGAISTVGSKQIEQRQPVNLLDALQGQAAGVLIINDGGGAPGAEGTVQIRGASTFSGGSGPLYLVDGVINPNGSSINPMDIEKIELLKDAASSAIYGARAANGIIIITTKKGKEGKPRIDLGYSRIYGKLAHQLPQNNSAEVREFRRIQAGNTSGSTGGNTDSLNPGFNSDNDLQQLLLGNTGDRQQINIGVSGAAKGLSYYAGVNYVDDKSIILNSYMKRIQARTNVEYQASPNLKYTNNITFTWQKGNDISLARTVNVAFDRPAFSLIYYPDGSLTSYIGSKRNPVANALYEKNITETYSAQFNNSIQYKIYKDLTFTTLFNAILTNRQYTFFSPRYVSANKDQNNGTNEVTKDFSWEYQAFLNYNKTFGKNKDHSLQGLVGFSADRRRYDRTHTEYANIVNEELLVTFPAYITAANSYSDATSNTGANLFTRWNYSYKGKYILAGIYRRDASSRFGANSRWGNFYSGSAAWRFSDESFMDWSRSALDDGKLRISYGQVGNDRIGNNDYPSLTTISFTGNYNGVGGAATGAIFGNSFVHWETTIQQNIGLDLNLFKGRLQFTADYYVKTTKELLYQKPIPAETGFTLTSVNVGSIETRGLEFSVKGTPVVAKSKNSGITWETGGNISFERGKVTELANGIPFIAGNKWYVEQGGKLGNFFGWRNLGVFQWNESNAYDDNWDKLTVVLDPTGVPLYANGKPVYTQGGKPYAGNVRSLYDPAGKLRGGDAEWENINKDSLIDDRDRQIIGNAQPKFYLGVINNITYNQFSLSFLINASFGANVYNTLLYNQSYPSNTGAGSPDLVHNVWRKQGDIARYPYYPERANRGSLKQNGNSMFIEDASFLRLSSVRLSYAIPLSVATRMFLKGATVYVYGTNLLTWTNYRGFDPEFSSSSVLTQGDDTGKYPKRREMGFGVNVNF
ncbi:MAG: SusC/RagA family TonB-linked outer membrane protein [Sediminibacterium sp.]